VTLKPPEDEIGGLFFYTGGLMETFVITLLYTLLALPVAILGGALIGIVLGTFINWYRDSFGDDDYHRF